MTGRVCPEGIEEYVTDISRMEISFRMKIDKRL